MTTKKANAGVNGTMQIKLGKKRILTNGFTLYVGTMKLVLEVDKFSGNLRIMDHGCMGKRLLVLPEVANVIQLGNTRC